MSQAAHCRFGRVTPNNLLPGLSLGDGVTPDERKPPLIRRPWSTSVDRSVHSDPINSLIAKEEQEEFFRLQEKYPEQVREKLNQLESGG